MKRTAPPIASVSAALLLTLTAGEFPKTLNAFPGTSPKIDGVLSKGEWDDATTFAGVSEWIAQFSPTYDDRDLSLRGWVKHDGRRLYFAFEVRDDVLYGIDTERWLPDENPKAHDLTREGFPWFGDEMEVLLNPSYKWKGTESVAGNGSSWQMVCNLTKSRLGGVGKGGILEGEPRRSEAAWNTYRKWIETRAMEAVARVADGKSKPRRYVIEWAANFDPCLEIEPGKFYSTAMGDKPMGLNIALGDLDEKERGKGNFGHFNHEDWWSGAKGVRTQLRQFGTLWIRTSPRSNPSKR